MTYIVVNQAVIQVLPHILAKTYLKVYQILHCLTMRPLVPLFL